MAKRYVPGKSPAPKSWQETAEILKERKTAKKKPNATLERLTEIERMLKEKS